MTQFKDAATVAPVGLLDHHHGDDQRGRDQDGHLEAPCDPLASLVHGQQFDAAAVLPTQLVEGPGLGPRLGT